MEGVGAISAGGTWISKETCTPTTTACPAAVLDGRGLGVAEDSVPRGIKRAAEVAIEQVQDS